MFAVPALSIINLISLLATAFMVITGFRVYRLDRRWADRMVVGCSLIAQIAAISMHSLYSPLDVAAGMIVTESVLLILVIRSSYIYRAEYGAIIFSSIVLSYMFGLDYVYGTEILYSGEEPSGYTILQSILTTIQGLIFSRTATHARRITIDRDFSHCRVRNRSVGKG
jgi:hypothetical protein